MKYWKVIADKLSAARGRGVIAAPLPEMAGVELSMHTEETGTATSFILTNC